FRDLARNALRRADRALHVARQRRGLGAGEVDAAVRLAEPDAPPGEIARPEDEVAAAREALRGPVHGEVCPRRPLDRVEHRRPRCRRAREEREDRPPRRRLVDDAALGERGEALVPEGLVEEEPGLARLAVAGAAERELAVRRQQRVEAKL